MIDATPGNEIPILIDEAEKLFKDNKFEESLKSYENLIGMDSANPKIIVGFLRCLIQLKRFEDAKEMFNSFDDNILENEEILKIKKLIDTIDNEKSDTSHEQLIEELKLSPKNKELRFKVAQNYLNSSEIKNGFNELLILFEQDPKWNDGASKKKLLEFFDVLGFNDPNVIEARKKLSSMMFK